MLVRGGFCDLTSDTLARIALLVQIFDYRVAMSRRYFHRTPVGEAILLSGFRDASGSYGLAASTLTGVFLSDVPLDINEGAEGGDLLEVTLPADVALDDFELVEEGKPYREWCVPASLLNDRGSIRLVSDGAEQW